jgi:hypothetical protein
MFGGGVIDGGDLVGVLKRFGICRIGVRCLCRMVRLTAGRRRI